MPEVSKQECEDVAEAAWAAIKDENAPEWGLTPLSHREVLLYKAQSVKRSGVADDEFEKKVAELLRKPKDIVAPVSIVEVKQGKLPENFPGHAALAEADINTYAQLRKAGDIKEVPGIGKATAAKIAEALNDGETVH